MYAPATPALPAVPLAPVGIAATQAAPPAAPPARIATALSVRDAVLDVLAGHAVTIAGVLAPALAGRPIELQARAGARWRTIAGTQTGAHGRYRLRYRPRRLGSALVRMRFLGNRSDRGSHRRLGRLNVFHLAGASWYGGGGGLACGGELTSTTLGVANKTLPCGTLVTLRYDGHTVRVPVIDRGPYVAGREYDLTEATKRELGFGDTGELWATS